MGGYVGRLAYGDAWVEDFLPARVADEGRLLPLRVPEGVPELPDVEGALRRALETSETPDRLPPLKEVLAGYRGGDVCLLVDDHTRPCAHQRLLLPPLLSWLQGRGVPRERISIVPTTATHRDPRPEEYPSVLGDAVWPAWRDRVVPHHDQEDLERLGTMPDGVPVEVNGRVARSEVIVGLSDLDYHYFAGVTGGPKQIVPGVAGRTLTTREHLRMFGDVGFAPGVDMGVLDGNPVYEYKRAAVRIILDALRARGATFYAIVTVLNPRHRLVAAAGGDVLEVHRRLRPVLDRVYVADLPRRADIAIVSARHLGLNVYQACKAINTAARAVKPGGYVVCLAPCPDGFGNEEFRDQMVRVAPLLQRQRKHEDGSAAIERALREAQDAAMADFRVGKQKPVDLLVQCRHLGWGHLVFVCEGLSAKDKALLPFVHLDGSGADPSARLRAWVEEQERRGSPAYVILDDPTYWIREREPGLQK